MGLSTKFKPTDENGPDSIVDPEEGPKGQNWRWARRTTEFRNWDWVVLAIQGNNARQFNYYKRKYFHNLAAANTEIRLLTTGRISSQGDRIEETVGHLEGKLHHIKINAHHDDTDENSVRRWGYCVQRVAGGRIQWEFHPRWVPSEDEVVEVSIDELVTLRRQSH